MPSTNALLEVKNLSKTFSRKRGTSVVAVAPMDLQVVKGEYVAIVGASGSGKTTLQLMLGAMLPPSTGQVLLDGVDVYGLTSRERAKLRRARIGFVFQSFHLLPYLSARENIQIPLWLSGTDTAVHDDKANALLERLGLADRADHRPSELSAGQQQRVALARVLANQPDVILADEPTGNLDPENSADVSSFLRTCADEGTTLVVVTHDPEVAKRADRTIRLTEGAIEAQPSK